MMKNNKVTKYSNIRVLLIEGRARQIMPLMKSLHDFGTHITTYNSSRLDMGYSSRYPNKKILSYCNPSNPEKTWECIFNELKTKKYDLVIPLNDYVAIMLSKHKEELKPYVSIATNDWDVFQNACDKLNTMKICMENRIPCPKTFLFEDNVANLGQLDIDFPVCVKPRTGYGAVGFHVINNSEDLRPILEASISKYGPCLIQEYIPQTDLQYKAEIYIDRNGIMKSACVFSKLRWYPIDGGSSTLNVTVNRPDIVTSCMKLLTLLGWRGYADIDLIQDPRDGVAKIMEINPRITGSVKICYAAGVNFTKQILQDYLNEEVDLISEYKIGQFLRYFHTDLLWFLHSKNRWKCKPSWFNFRHSTDQIWMLSDPWPWFTYTLAGLLKIRKDKKSRKIKL